MQFLDAHNFDVRSVKKSCVHIMHPDGRMIPFDTYNMFYRDDKEELLEGAEGRGCHGLGPVSRSKAMHSMPMKRKVDPSLHREAIHCAEQ